MIQRLRKGFTVVELLIVISIIGILAAVVLANLSGSTKRGRDAERQADLRNLQNAVEAYKQKNGKYPDMGTDGNSDTWASENESGGEYIVGLAPAFITSLPRDAAKGSSLGYAYTVSTDGSVYKIMAYNTVESETVTDTHPFKRCDTSGMCSAYDDDALEPCSPDNVIYKKSYAAWGGFADQSTEALVRSETAKIICK